jgi:4-amino-4-deoxy-L-arabinose transferase-like glycosyltransferase
LLYLVALRLALRRVFAVFAVLLFGLSPLALHYQRMVLLDNIAVGWLLAAFALALTPARRPSAYAFAGVCFGGAVLTKETFLLFLPALVLAIWQSSHGQTRRLSLGVFAGLFVLIAGLYPLFATLRGGAVPRGTPPEPVCCTACTGSSRATELAASSIRTAALESS